MDTFSSGEDLIIKARKPYTITKQRERWTEEEHNRFLEALKLYGRAWQRIEEHIGTKTAVQIRSHAQKFFSKLEKEAVSKGVPVGQSIDIDIPPPRPKRKPSNPYPRKSGAAAPTWSTSHVGEKDGKLVSSASSHSKLAVDLEIEELDERPSGEEKQNYGKENKDDSCSEVFTLLSDSHCSSMSSANKCSITAQAALRNACTFREFVPSVKKVMTRDVTNESFVTVELNGNQNLKKTDAKKIVQDNATSEASKSENTNAFKLVQGVKADDLNCALPTDGMQSTPNFPRNVPIHILDGSVGECNQTTTPDLSLSFQDSVFCPMGKIHGQPNVLANQAASTTTTENESTVSRSCIHQSFPAIPSAFGPFHHNLEDYRSSLHISSTFSSLIVSSLLQNPAAHAAASFAATFWPYTNAENKEDSPACSAGCFPPGQMSSPPNMAAIAAATVAAATAWWAAHGLLPLCAPLQTSFSSPVPMTGVSSMDKGQAPATKTEKGENSLLVPSSQDQKQNPEHSEAVQGQHSPSKSPTTSSSHSDNGGVKPDNGSKADDNEKDVASTEVQDSDKAKSKKQVDRSSCGSNTTSSSEVETDALEKQEKGKEELKEPDTNHPASDSSFRRARSAINMSDSWKERHMNDSWKEVSEEGRMAFQALFSREVLPQSFSPPPDLMDKGHQDTKEGHQNGGGKDGSALMLDLNSKAWAPFRHPEVEKIASPVGLNDAEGLLTLGLGYGKQKAHRTGFKPYKRCSVEANENRVANASSHCEEKGPKRLRLEGETST